MPDTRAIEFDATSPRPARVKILHTSIMDLSPLFISGSYRLRSKVYVYYLRPISSLQVRDVTFQL